MDQFIFMGMTVCVFVLHHIMRFSTIFMQRASLYNFERRYLQTNGLNPVHEYCTRNSIMELPQLGLTKKMWLFSLINAPVMKDFLFNCKFNNSSKKDLKSSITGPSSYDLKSTTKRPWQANNMVAKLA